MPTGSPSRVRPMGAVVAGRPVRVAKEIQKSRSRYWREPSGVVNRRSKILGLWSCGKAATKAVGKRKASWVRKYSCQTARAALRRLTAAEKCLNGAVHARACLADRKSTRLNSSHSQISYAVFCLKKKKKTSNGGRYASITTLQASTSAIPIILTIDCDDVLTTRSEDMCVEHYTTNLYYTTGHNMF